MILITGGTGFLGGYIIKQLVEKGYAVRALRRNKKLPLFHMGETANQVEWIEGEVLNEIALKKAMEGIDTVIHAAGIVSFEKNNRSEMYKVNTEGTANMVKVALEKKVKRFMHVSSISAVGISATGGYINEEKEWEESKLNTHYAVSKFQAEQEVWRGIRKGLKAVILNPSTVLGYGDWSTGSCALFKTVYKGFTWYSSGAGGFVDVEDVARVTMLLMERNISGQRFILNSENWTFKRLIETIAAGFGSPHPPKPLPPLLLSMLWRLEALKSFLTAQPPLVTREIALSAQSNTCFENSKILKALPGFSFLPIEQSIKKACEQYLEMAKGSS